MKYKKKYKKLHSKSRYVLLINTLTNNLTMDLIAIQSNSHEHKQYFTTEITDIFLSHLVVADTIPANTPVRLPVRMGRSATFQVFSGFWYKSGCNFCPRRLREPLSSDQLFADPRFRTSVFGDGGTPRWKKTAFPNKLHKAKPACRQGAPRLSQEEVLQSCLLYSVVFGGGGWRSFCYSNLSCTLTERQTVTKQFLIRTYMSQLIALPHSNLKLS